MFYRARRWLHVFPRLALVVCFPVLGTGCMFSRARQWLHVLYASCLLEKPLHSIRRLQEIRAAEDSKIVKQRRPQISAARLNNIKPALNQSVCSCFHWVLRFSSPYKRIFSPVSISSRLGDPHENHLRLMWFSM